MLHLYWGSQEIVRRYLSSLFIWGGHILPLECERLGNRSPVTTVSSWMCEEKAWINVQIEHIRSHEHKDVHDLLADSLHGQSLSWGFLSGGGGTGHALRVGHSYCHPVLIHVSIPPFRLGTPRGLGLLAPRRWGLHVQHKKAPSSRCYLAEWRLCGLPQEAIHSLAVNHTGKHPIPVRPHCSGGKGIT